MVDSTLQFALLAILLPIVVLFICLMLLYNRN
jgi:hypothetical protein